MTKIEELEQKLDNAVEKFRLEMNECQKALAELKESKKESKKEKWLPKYGEKYWARTDEGEFDWWNWIGDNTDNWRYKNMPLFPTKEACERYWRFMDTVKEKSYSFSEEEWEDDEIDKLVIYYDYTRKEFGVTCTFCKYLGEIYFKDKESAQYIIDNFKDEFMEFIL